MTTVKFEVPDDLLQALNGTPEAATREIRLAAALHWCSRGEMGTSRAAQLARLTYTQFLEEAARRKVDLYHYDIDDIKDEVARTLPEGVDPEAIKQDVACAQSRRG